MARLQYGFRAIFSAIVNLLVHEQHLLWRANNYLIKGSRNNIASELTAIPQLGSE